MNREVQRVPSLAKDEMSPSIEIPPPSQEERGQRSRSLMGECRGNSSLCRGFGGVPQDWRIQGGSTISRSKILNGLSSVRRIWIALIMEVEQEDGLYLLQNRQRRD